MNSNQLRAFSISIFVPDGNIDGLKIIEKSNWIGVGVTFDKIGYEKTVTRPEFNKTGVYILVGKQYNNILPAIYIGESDFIGNRIKIHNSKKDFWDWGIFFASKDNSLNKAHAKYLESKLIALAKEVNQCKLNNIQTSSSPALLESEIANMESFFFDMLGILSLLGLNMFKKTKSNTTLEKFLYIKNNNIKAVAYNNTEEFILKQGSEITKHELTSIPHYLTTLRRGLLSSGILSDMGKYYFLTQDFLFNSPSTAAGVVLGRSANGKMEWKNEEGIALKYLHCSNCY